MFAAMPEPEGLGGGLEGSDPEPDVGSPDEETQSFPASPMRPPSGESTEPIVDDVGTIPQRIRYIGDYELRRFLGCGGMGVVYEARQLSLDRPVAVKLLRSGVFASRTEIRRFENEARSIARLDHPSIVRVHEIGEFEGSPYFSMELIRGRGLGGYAAGLSRNFRLAAELTATVAEAVHHAHRLGILHRDLKPSNILVSEVVETSEGVIVGAVPHVTDFGLAKQVDGDESLTGTGEVIGTPAYMAPEVAAGHPGAVTTSADIYGIGAILYSVLVGHAPYTGDSALAILNQVRNSDPERPSRKVAGVPSDLEAICLKAMAREPWRRYDSAQALANDLRNWVAARPIMARPASPIERLGLWCRRQPALAGLAAALLVATLGGVIGITWNWLEARRQEKLLGRANVELARERDSLREINAFLNGDILGAANPEVTDRGEALTVEQALDRAAESLEERFAGRPDLEASVRSTLAGSYRSLGEYKKARPQIERAAALYRLSRGESHPETLTSADNHAALLLDLGDEAGAERLARATLAAWGKWGGAMSADARRSAANLAAILQRRGRLEEAERLYERVIESGSPQDRTVLSAMGNLATLYQERGRDGEAEPLYRAVLASRESTLRPDHPATLLVRSNLAACLYQQRKLAEARAELDRAVGSMPRVLGEDHPATRRMRSVLAAILLELGKPEESLEVMKSLKFPDAGPGNRDAFEAANNYAITLVRLDRLEEAEPLMRACFQLREVAESNDPNFLKMRINFGRLLLDLGHTEESLAHFEAAGGDYRALFPADHPEQASLRLAHATALCRVGRPVEALPLNEEAVKIRERIYGATDPLIFSAKSALGGTLLALGRLEEAGPILTESAEQLLMNGKQPADRIAHAVDRVIAYHEVRGEPEAVARWRERRPAGKRRWIVPRPD